MANLIRGMQKVNEFLNKHEDGRTANWFLMSSPFYTLGICLSYVIIVKRLGPQLMKNRKRFQFRRILVVYNVLQVLFNAWLFYRISVDGWFSGNYNWRCQPVDYSNKPETLRVVEVCWWYYFSKIVDFFDTFFFILMKKFDHISTLHVIHHGLMPVSTWFGVKLAPNGHGTFGVLANTFIHVVMYSYYMLSAFGPRIQKYLWWKRYITALQMVQFIAVIIHAFQLLFIECDYPLMLAWVPGLHAILFFSLFSEFYNKSYTKKDKLANSSTNISNGQTLHNSEVKNHQNHEHGHPRDVELTKRYGHASDYYTNGPTSMDNEHSVKSR